MPFIFVLLLSLLTGFIALSYELLWYRVYAFVSMGSPAAFGVLLGAYLLGIANGALRARDACRAQPLAEPRHLVRLAGFLVAASLVGGAVIPVLGRWVGRWHWFPSLGLVVVATTFFGATLPLICHLGIAADARAGQRLSYVYLANIAGSAAGSLLTGFVLLDRFPLRQVAVLLLVAGLALAALLLVEAARRSALSRARALAALLALALCGATAVVAAPSLFADLYERLLWKTKLKPGARFAEVVENRSGVITVAADGAVYGGGAYDGRFNTRPDGTDPNAVRRAYVLAALHPAPKKVLMIGLATGSWAEVLAHLPGVDELTVVEINPGYREVIARHPMVAGILTDPRIKLVIDDGRRYLLRHPDERFDAIVMNTTWHYRAFTTNLLSREFLELLRAHLLPGGVGWFNTTNSADAMRTAATVFPYALLYSNFIAVSDGPVTFDSARLRRALVDYRVDGHPLFDLADPAVPARLDELASPLHLIRTREQILGNASSRVITDDNMACEWSRVPKDADPLGVFSDEL